jgi:hypothetical protein
MTRKQWLLLAFALMLGGISLYLNKDYFAGDNIHIYHRSRPARMGLFRRKKTTAEDSLVDPVLFGFDRKLKLKAVQVIPIADIETNKYPHAIWDLVSESNSVPTRDLTYGIPLKGMHARISGTFPDQLQPGERYRLLIETASKKAQHDFIPAPKTP